MKIRTLLTAGAAAAVATAAALAAPGIASAANGPAPATNVAQPAAPASFDSSSGTVATGSVSSGTPAVVTVPPDGNGADPAAVRATPLARRLAQAHGVDLTTLEGTGPRGRITRADVAARAEVSDPAPAPTAPTASTASTAPPADGDQHVELTRLQQVVARRRRLDSLRAGP